MSESLEVWGMTARLLVLWWVICMNCIESLDKCYERS